MQTAILLKMSLLVIMQNINWKTLQGQKGHNNDHDSISQESPQSNHYKMSSFIFIAKHYACRNSSYLNGVLRVINATNGHSRERKKGYKEKNKDKSTDDRYHQCEPQHCKDKTISSYHHPLLPDLSENHSNNNQTWPNTHEHLHVQGGGGGRKVKLLSKQSACQRISQRIHSP